MSAYPECDKMLSVRPKSQLIGDFLEWLQEQSFAICEYGTREGQYWPIRKSIEQLLADYFDIDLKEAEKEKSDMLKSFVNKNDKNKIQNT